MKPCIYYLFLKSICSSILSILVSWLILSDKSTIFSHSIWQNYFWSIYFLPLVLLQGEAFLFCEVLYTFSLQKRQMLKMYEFLYFFSLIEFESEFSAPVIENVHINLRVNYTAKKSSNDVQDILLFLVYKGWCNILSLPLKYEWTFEKNVHQNLRPHSPIGDLKWTGLYFYILFIYFYQKFKLNPYILKKLLYNVDQ